MSNEVKKIDELFSRIDKVEVELVGTKLNIKELALGFKDQKLDMKRLLILQKKNGRFKG